MVSSQTALDPEGPQISRVSARRGSTELGLTMTDVRQDRIRDEAAFTADPLHLMRLFGISSSTAMHYITATHPERTAKAPH